jgi:hypothetical protein
MGERLPPQVIREREARAKRPFSPNIHFRASPYAVKEKEVDSRCTRRRGMISVLSEAGAMRKRESIAVGIVLALAAGAWYWNTWRRSESTLSSLRLPVNGLRGRVEKERVASAEAVEKYRPTAAGRVDELGRPVADLLRQLPGVAEVKEVPAGGKLARLLIHLRAGERQHQRVLGHASLPLSPVRRGATPTRPGPVLGAE